MIGKGYCLVPFSLFEQHLWYCYYSLAIKCAPSCLTIVLNQANQIPRSLLKSSQGKSQPTKVHQPEISSWTFWPLLLLLLVMLLLLLLPQLLWLPLLLYYYHYISSSTYFYHHFYYYFCHCWYYFYYHQPFPAVQPKEIDEFEPSAILGADPARLPWNNNLFATIMRSFLFIGVIGGVVVFTSPCFYEYCCSTIVPGMTRQENSMFQ